MEEDEEIRNGRMRAKGATARCSAYQGGGGGREGRGPRSYLSIYPETLERGRAKRRLSVLKFRFTTFA